MAVPAFAIFIREVEARIILKAMIRKEEYHGPLRKHLYPWLDFARINLMRYWMLDLQSTLPI
jgi:hypothetical protein